MSKALILGAIWFFVASSSYAAILENVNIQGYVSKVLPNDVLIYSEGQLTEIPKTFLKNASAVKVGQQLNVEMSFEEARKLKHPAIKPAPKAG